MEFLPYEHFYIETDLMYTELIKRLRRTIDPSFHLTEPSFPKKQYYGQITPDGFRVHRWLRTGQHESIYAVSPFSFPAVVSGDFLEATNGRIIISMRLSLHWTALIAFFLWLLFYGFISAVLLDFILSSFTIRIPYMFEVLLGSFLMLILLCTYGTMMAFFERNARHEKQFFLELIDDEW